MTLLCVVAFFTLRKHVENFLSKGKIRRAFITALPATLMLTVAGIITNWINPLSSEPDVRSVVALSVAFALIAMSFWGQIAISIHGDTWNEKLTALQTTYANDSRKWQVESRTRAQAEQKKCYDAKKSLAATHKQEVRAKESIITQNVATIEQLTVRLNDDQLKWEQEKLAVTEQATQNLEFVQTVNRTFLGVVSFKADRIRRVAERDGPLRVPCALLEALNPSDQIFQLLISVYRIYADRLTRRHIQGTVRVTYFELEGRHLVPKRCWNGRSPHCVSSLGKRREVFNIDQTAGSVAVAVAQTGQIVIASDAKVADQNQDHPFRFFDAPQHAQIGSMVALPLVRDGERPAFAHVLAIDSTVPGFFADSPQERTELSFVADNLAQRLRFECDVIGSFLPQDK